jgi:hypothetical protein
MKACVKKRWVKELRSGNYKQCAMAMWRDGRYCVYGILCIIYDQENGGNHWDEFGNHMGRASCPHQKVLQWAGIPQLGLMIDGKSLNWYNDQSGMNFAQIADLIENNVAEEEIVSNARQFA